MLNRVTQVFGALIFRRQPMLVDTHVDRAHLVIREMAHSVQVSARIDSVNNLLKGNKRAYIILSVSAGYGCTTINNFLENNTMDKG